MGVPVVQSFVSIPDKPKGEGVLTDSSCLNKAKMRTNSNLIFYNPSSKTDEEKSQIAFNQFFYAIDFNRLTLILK